MIPGHGSPSGTSAKPSPRPSENYSISGQPLITCALARHQGDRLFAIMERRSLARDEVAPFWLVNLRQRGQCPLPAAFATSRHLVVRDLLRWRAPAQGRRSVSAGLSRSSPPQSGFGRQPWPGIRLRWHRRDRRKSGLMPLASPPEMVRNVQTKASRIGIAATARAGVPPSGGHGPHPVAWHGGVPETGHKSFSRRLRPTTRPRAAKPDRRLRCRTGH